MERKLTVIDLFCGIGGFSKGFEKAGYDILLGIDNWDIALETFKDNHKDSKVISADIREIPDSFYLEYKDKVDIIMGGPPCQGFSMSGKRNIDDDRNTLFQELIRCVKNINPKIVIIENVVGLLSMKTPSGKFVKDKIIEDLSKLGYETNFKTLDASKYGVPQARKRVVFIGSRIGKIDFPEELKYQVTVGDALGNIPDTTSTKYLEPKTDFQKMMSDGEKMIFNHVPMKHNAVVQRRFSYVPEGGNWRNIPRAFYNVGGEHSNNYRRLDSKKPSITIKHATKSMIIPPKYDRVITAREVARLQSFSDSFIIKGNVSEQHQQLANAVPPLLAFEIAKKLKNYLVKND